MKGFVCILLVLSFLCACKEEKKTPIPKDTTIEEFVPKEVPDSVAKNNENSIHGLKVTRYAIESFCNHRDGEKMHENVIVFTGIPYFQGSKVTRAELRFSHELGPKLLPYYDSSKKTIFAYYYMDQFSDFYEMLKHAQGDFVYTYQYSKKWNKHFTYNRINGKLPLRP